MNNIEGKPLPEPQSRADQYAIEIIAQLQAFNKALSEGFARLLSDRENQHAAHHSNTTTKESVQAFQQAQQNIKPRMDTPRNLSAPRK